MDTNQSGVVYHNATVGWERLEEWNNTICLGEDQAVWLTKQPDQGPKG